MKDLNEEIRIEEALNKNGFLISTFKGISMLPLLDEQNDLVKLKKVDSLLEIDDMALFKRGDKLVLHRIIDVKDDYYEIVGDNQTVIENVPFENVVGKVVGYYKKGRYVSLDSLEYQTYLNNLEKDLNKRVVYDHFNEIPKLYFDVLKLIRCLINDEDFNEKLDYEELFAICNRQNISAYVFPKINKELCTIDIYQKWEAIYNSYVHKDLTPKTDNNEYYINFINDFYRQYINNDIDISKYLDIYYLRKNLTIDYEYCDKKFREMGINEFHEYTIRLIDVLFSDNTKLPISDINFIFTGYAYGTKKHLIRRKIKELGKLKYALSRIFPSYASMCTRFKILKKAPYLLPFAYIYRAFSIIINSNSRKRLKTEFKIFNENGKQDN